MCFLKSSKRWTLLRSYVWCHFWSAVIDLKIILRDGGENYLSEYVNKQNVRISGSQILIDNTSWKLAEPATTVNDSLVGIIPWRCSCLVFFSIWFRYRAMLTDFFNNQIVKQWPDCKRYQLLNWWPNVRKSSRRGKNRVSN